jgi:hypothetical protein
LADPLAFDVPPEPVDEGLPSHAAIKRAAVVVAMMAATLRAAGCTANVLMPAVLRAGT